MGSFGRSLYFGRRQRPRRALVLLSCILFSCFFVYKLFTASDGLVQHPVRAETVERDSVANTEAKGSRKGVVSEAFNGEASDGNRQKFVAIIGDSENRQQKEKDAAEEEVESRQPVDWHNAAAMAVDASRSGAGEGGQAFRLPADHDGDRKRRLFNANGFNALASDSIALDRAVRDIRHAGCRTAKYAARLPTVSVVIPFHNEHLSTLLRSVYSIVNRSPRELLEEVILADDLSDKEFLLAPRLERELANRWNESLVRVVRPERREGLIRARLMGARTARGDVLLFLDSHSECNYNWLPPLLDPIAKDRKTAVCPFVDVIDYDTFEYRPQDEGARGAFDWELYYKRLPLLAETLKRPTEPFDNPVMAGGYFAIDKNWFWELGGYDEGLEIWGGEQYELSFKLWQCGGRLVDAPCSRVGHVYRKFSPFPNAGKGDFIGRNYKRVAEVWMDEYKEYIYMRRPHYRTLDPGDLSNQKALRRLLNCKPFKWFMEKVAFDLTNRYPPVSPPNAAEGELWNGNESGDGTRLCVDTKFAGPERRFELDTCLRDDPSAGGEQYMQYTNQRELRPKRKGRQQLCFDASSRARRSPVVLYPCHGQGGNQLWFYRLSSGQLFHPTTGRCLDCNPDSKELFVEPCSAEADTQRWSFDKTNETMLRDWAMDER